MFIFDGLQDAGIAVGGQVVNVMGCADDGAVVSGGRRGLRCLMDGLGGVAEDCGMGINVGGDKGDVHFSRGCCGGGDVY